MNQPERQEPVEMEPAPRRRRKLLQWNIATLLLLTAVVGVWVFYFRMNEETELLQAELDSLKQLARELVVHDPTKYAIVEQLEEWYQDDQWEIYLPEGATYNLRLATREIDDLNFPATDHVAELAAGRHTVSLEKTYKGEDASAKVVVDGQIALQVPEGTDWYEGTSHGWSGGYSRLQQKPVSEPLELIRIRFQKPDGKGGSVSVQKPYNGLFLWIDRK